MRKDLYLIAILYFILSGICFATEHRPETKISNVEAINIAKKAILDEMSSRGIKLNIDGDDIEVTLQTGNYAHTSDALVNTDDGYWAVQFLPNKQFARFTGGQIVKVDCKTGQHSVGMIK